MIIKNHNSKLKSSHLGLAIALALMGSVAMAQTAIPTSRTPLTTGSLKSKVTPQVMPDTNQAKAEAALFPQGSAQPSSLSGMKAPDVVSVPAGSPSVSLQKAVATPVFPATPSSASSVVESGGSDTPSGVPYKFSGSGMNKLDLLSNLDAGTAVQEAATKYDSAVEKRKEMNASAVGRPLKIATTSSTPSAGQIPAATPAAPALAVTPPEISAVYGFGKKQYVDVILPDGSMTVASPGTVLPNHYKVTSVRPNGAWLAHGKEKPQFFPVVARSMYSILKPSSSRAAATNVSAPLAPTNAPLPSLPPLPSSGRR